MDWFFKIFLPRGGVGEFIPNQNRLQKIIEKIKKIFTKGER